MVVTGRQLLGVLLAAVVTVLVAGLSRLPWVAHRGESAAVRLAWKFRSERIERCRRLSPEELAGQPAHMRREEVCEGAVRPYRLVVDLDGRRALDDTIRATGAHADRPLSFLHEVALAPGVHQLSVRFSALDGAAGSVVLGLDRRLVLAPRQVALVTYDAGRGDLVILGYGNAATNPPQPSAPGNRTGEPR